MECAGRPIFHGLTIVPPGAGGVLGFPEISQKLLRQVLCFLKGLSFIEEIPGRWER
jgi:hypothetical protein